MTEPTEDEVLLKAKQPARDDGRLRLWGSSSISSARPVVIPPTMCSGRNISFERESC